MKAKSKKETKPGTVGSRATDASMDDAAARAESTSNPCFTPNICPSSFLAQFAELLHWIIAALVDTIGSTNIFYAAKQPE